MLTSSFLVLGCVLSFSPTGAESVSESQIEGTVTSDETAVLAETGDIAWHFDPVTALLHAHDNEELVLWVYSGFSCAECRHLEEALLPDVDVSVFLQRMVLLQVFVDGDDAASDAVHEKLQDHTGGLEVPSLVITDSAGQVVAVQVGVPQSAGKLYAFLRDAVSANDSAREPEVEVTPDETSVSEVSGTPGLVLSGTRWLSNGASARIELDGRWTLLYFWGSWCVPCVSELESFLATLGTDFSWQGGRFVTVALEDDETVGQAKSFLEKVGVPSESAFRLASEANASAVSPLLEWDGYHVPYLALLAPDGTVAWRHQGEVSEAMVRQALEAAGFAFASGAQAKDRKIDS